MRSDEKYASYGAECVVEVLEEYGYADNARELITTIQERKTLSSPDWQMYAESRRKRSHRHLYLYLKRHNGIMVFTREKLTFTLSRIESECPEVLTNIEEKCAV